MPEIFFISDLHLGHARIIEWSSARSHYTTVEEHDEDLVKRWNSVVTKRDVVWVLGDVVFPRTSMKYLAELNGMKSLVLGNHDKGKLKDLKQYFSRVEGAVGFKDNTVLTHIPVHTSQVGRLERWSANIHGHMHEDSLDDPRYYNVSADVINLRPKPYTEILEELKEKGVYDK